MVSLDTLISFWKRKETSSAPESERIIPLPTIPQVSLDASRSTSMEAATQARDALKVLKLERQILGTALTTIYESHSKGLISQVERDRLLEKYKVDLSSLEKAIGENERVVDLFDLESSREELLKTFKAKLAEIDAQVKTLKSGGSLNAQSRKSGQEGEASNPGANRDGERKGKDEPAKEKRSSESDQQQITDAEKRVEQIRDEILKAMDRLEQIEAEG